MEEQLMESRNEDPLGEPAGRRRPYRSLFWPIVFIGVGIVWLLLNLGIIESVNVWGFLHLWPLLLIFIGLDVLFGRRWPALGAVVGLAAVGVVIFLLVVGSPLGWFDSGPRWIIDTGEGGWTFDQPDIQTAHFEEAVNDATSAEVNLNVSFWPVEVSPLPAGSDNLVEADIAYFGEAIFDVSGESSRSVTVGMDEVRVRSNLEFDYGDYTWNIGLSPDVPVDLQVNGGMGSGDFDLRGLQLEDLAINGAMGEITLFLPATGSGYDAEINTGMGSVDVSVDEGAEVALGINGGLGETQIDVGPNADVALSINTGAGSVRLQTAEGANVDVTMNNGLGSTEIYVPEGAGVRLEIHQGERGLGSVSVPPGYVTGDDGVLESPNYDDADYQVRVTIDSLGMGSVAIHQ